MANFSISNDCSLGKYNCISHIFRKKQQLSVKVVKFSFPTKGLSVFRKVRWLVGEIKYTLKQLPDDYQRGIRQFNFLSLHYNKNWHLYTITYFSSFYFDYHSFFSLNTNIPKCFAVNLNIQWFAQRWPPVNAILWLPSPLHDVVIHNFSGIPMEIRINTIL